LFCVWLLLLFSRILLLLIMLRLISFDFPLFVDIVVGCLVDVDAIIDDIVVNCWLLLLVVVHCYCIWSVIVMWLFVIVICYIIVVDRVVYIHCCDVWWYCWLFSIVIHCLLHYCCWALFVVVVVVWRFVVVRCCCYHLLLLMIFIDFVVLFNCWWWCVDH
jgi:hypothetical protein